MEITEKVGLADKLQKKSKKTEEITDALAHMVKADFDVAIKHRNVHKFGDKTANQIINDCYDQYYGVLPCDIAEAFGEIPVPNLTQLKVSALNAWIRDLLFGSGGTPFTIEPTPIPELNQDMEEEILGRVKEILFAKSEIGLPQTPKEMNDLILQQKKAVRELTQASADRAAKLMEEQMWDQCIDGGYKKAFLQFLQDFCIYPYAVLEGPTPELRVNYVWSGNDLKAKEEVVYAVNRISPFDFFWSPDSTNAQDGSYVIVRKRYSKQQLFQMTKMKSYIRHNVIAALEYFSNTNNSIDWLSSNREEQVNIIPWDHKSPLEVLKYYGAVRGSVLKEYGMTDLEDDQYYECIIHTLGHFTLKVVINPNPNANLRPIFVTSYEKTGSGILGFGIAQKIREVERVFHACLRGLIKNMEYSSGPIGEVDFSRIQQWIDDDSVGNIEPYTINPVDPDPVNGGRTAYSFHNFPSNVGSLQQLCQWFLSLADIITQIPASIHGQPVGTGANRTFRGMSMLYGNALKGVQSGITNIDDDIISPFATSLYLLNLKFNPRKDIKGDAKVVARGASGLMERELKKNDMLEAAQIVASLAQTGRVRPETIDEAVNRVLVALDLVNNDPDQVVGKYLEESGTDPMAMAQQQQVAEQQPPSTQPTGPAPQDVQGQAPVQ